MTLKAAASPLTRQTFATSVWKACATISPLFFRTTFCLPEPFATIFCWAKRTLPRKKSPLPSRWPVWMSLSMNWKTGWTPKSASAALCFPADSGSVWP